MLLGLAPPQARPVRALPLHILGMRGCWWWQHVCRRLVQHRATTLQPMARANIRRVEVARYPYQAFAAPTARLCSARCLLTQTEWLCPFTAWCPSGRVIAVSTRDGKCGGRPPPQHTEHEAGRDDHAHRQWAPRQLGDEHGCGSGPPARRFRSGQVRLWRGVSPQPSEIFGPGVGLNHTHIRARTITCSDPASVPPDHSGRSSEFSDGVIDLQPVCSCKS